MPSERRIEKTVVAPPPQPGFIGEGHTAVEVLASSDLPGSDPFVLLMDDRLDIPRRRRIGGAHPHAGLETVTLVLEGTLHDRDEGALSAGDVVWMNAGRGIIHNEDVEAEGRSRILQLWIRLPARERGSTPSFQIVRAAEAPTLRQPGVTARLYSGATAGLRSPTANRAPVTLVDVALEPNASFAQPLPLSYNGFLYVVEGELEAGGARLAKGMVGWLDRPEGSGESALALRAGAAPARVILYAGEPQREPLVHHGPFVAGSMADIRALFLRFYGGDFVSMSALARAQAQAALEAQART